MSSIDRLLLYGIRSFGPDEKDRACIRFSSPLTLILGQNGCGKTTIIEALKYATCGELPGGTEGGSGFVHDPKLSGRIDTNGHVRLRCKNLKGEEITICRTVTVTQKPRKLEFKTKDSCVTDAEGRSLSTRCGDIDGLMCNTLGVSKAILTNVIFCHQEDSDWPLERGKKMKEKFDAIFGITEYNRCLDHMRVLAKKMDAEKMLLKKDVDHTAENWEETKKKKAHLEEVKRKMTASNDTVESFNRQIQPLELKYQELVEKHDNFNQHYNKVQHKKNEKELLLKSIKELEKSIDTQFFGSKEELNYKIKNFNLELETKKSKLQNLKNDREMLIAEEHRQQTNHSFISQKLISAQSEEEMNNNRIRQRNSFMKELSKDLKLSTSSSDNIDESDIEELLKLIEDKIKEKTEELKKFQEEQENDEKQLQIKIEHLREKKGTSEYEIKMKKKSIEENKKELQKVNNEIEDVDKSAEILGTLERNLAQVNRELDELVKALDVEQQKISIENYIGERNRLEKKVTDLDQEIRILQKFSFEKSHLDNLNKRKNKKDEEFTSLKEKVSSSLEHLLKEIPTSNFKNKLDARFKALETEIASQEQEISRKERELTILTGKKGFTEENLRKKQRKLAEDEDNIYECCRDKDFDAFINELKEKIEKSQDVKGTITSSEFLFKRYVEKLKSDNPLCPLCRREFNNEDEIKSVVDDLNKRLKEFPTRLNQTKVELDVLLEDQSRALQLKPVYDKITAMRKNEIPSLREEVNQINSKIKELENDINSRKNDLIEPSADKQMAKGLLEKVMQLDQIQKELKALEQDITAQEKKLPETGLSKTLQEANSEQDELKSELKKIRKDLEESQDKLSTHNEKLRKLSEKKNEITTKQMKIEGGAQRRRALTEKLEELRMQESFLSDELLVAEESLKPLLKNLEESSQSLRRKKFDHKISLDERQQKMNEQKNKFREISSLHGSVNEYNKSGNLDELKKYTKELELLDREKSNNSKERERLQKEIDSITQFCNTQQIKKFDLENSLKLFDKKEEMQKIDQEIRNLEGQVGTTTIQSITTQKAQVQRDIKRLEEQKYIAEGRLSQLKQNAREIETELNSSRYKNAEEEYRKNVISLKVLSLSIEDLKQYEKAMDWAMIYFHKERLKMINTIVRNYWRQVYGGNDIDTIEVKTDETQSSAGGRRNYNYRVIQIKNGTELDMPGRCSAGQKVLACLIIRIALAETFSKNCGILALDEPTTNLDRENIDRLSAALSDIANRRTNQKNFQLIIITHDEEFLRRLSSIDKVEHYLLVERNNSGKSEVRKMKF